MHFVLYMENASNLSEANDFLSLLTSIKLHKLSFQRLLDVWRFHAHIAWVVLRYADRIYIYQLYIILYRLVYCGLETLQQYGELKLARKTSPIQGNSWSSSASSGSSIEPSAKIFSSPAPSSSVLHLRLWKEAAVFDLINAMFVTRQNSWSLPN